MFLHFLTNWNILHSWRGRLRPPPCTRRSSWRSCWSSSHKQQTSLERGHHGGPEVQGWSQWGGVHQLWVAPAEPAVQGLCHCAPAPVWQDSSHPRPWEFSEGNCSAVHAAFLSSIYQIRLFVMTPRKCLLCQFVKWVNIITTNYQELLKGLFSVLVFREKGLEKIIEFFIPDGEQE